MSNIEQAKETWAEYQAESSFDDWKFVAGVLREHFFSQVEDMNEQEFKDYLENELGYEEDIINNMFEESDNEL